MKKVKSLSELKEGDLIQIYIHRTEGGASMGPEVEHDPENLEWVIFMGTLGTKGSVCNAMFMDGDHVGIPISLSDIQNFKPRNDLSSSVLYKYYLSHARTIGRHYTLELIDLFDRSPFSMNEKVNVAYDYASRNKTLNIRNNHRVLKAKDLVFMKRNGLIAEVWSPSIKKTAQVAIDCLTKKIS